MHIVAISSSFTAPINMLLTFGISKICYWRKYCIYFFTSKESAINFALCILGIIFVTVLYVNIARQMITQIINNNHILNFAKLTHLFENVFIKSLKSKISKLCTFIKPFMRLKVLQGYLK